MATQGSKGNTKKNSALQKTHYQVYRMMGMAERNLIKRLKTRVRRNAAMIKRKAARTPPREVKLDTGAINRLKSLTN